MKQKIVALVLVAVMAVSCGTTGSSALSGLGSALNLVQCDYSYNSLSNLSLSGMNLSGSNALSLSNIATITSILTGNANSIPMNFTVNLDVKNPNDSKASLSGLSYNLKIDGIQFTTGSLNQSFSVAGGSTQVLPLNVGFDLATLLSGGSRNSVVNIVKNFIGIGSEKSKVTLDLYPTINVSGISLKSPVAIPVSFSFGGK